MTRVLSLQPGAPPPVPIPVAGDVLGGKYRIERELGRGGMGIVYEVSHLVMTRKRFAVKWLLPLPEGYAEEDSLVAQRRFVREAEIAGGICHPNVVEVYDVNVSDDGRYMVMELLAGESLEARLKAHGPLDFVEACRIVSACAAGVGAAHAAHVIHRDLKPANIFLTAQPGSELPRPKVLDFGISRFVVPEDAAESAVTRAGTLIGTPMYMAPEQLRGFECDERTDVYGLGVTLYEALAGQPAFTAQTHADLVVRIVTGDVQPLPAGVPAGLAAVVMRALHHQPEQRFANVGALIEALRPYTVPAVGSVQAQTVPAVAEAAAHGRRWVVAVVAVGIAVLVLGLRWVNGQRSVEPAQPSLVKPKPPEDPVLVMPPSAAEDAVPVAEAPPQPEAAPPAAAASAKPTRQKPERSSPAPERDKPKPPPRAPKPRPQLDSL